MDKVEKALMIDFRETGDDRAVLTAIAALPAAIAEERGILSIRLFLALTDRDWLRANQLIERMKGGEDDGDFAYGDAPVPIGCYSILLAALNGEPRERSNSFAETREQLNQKFQASLGNARLLSKLAVVDALLGRKEEAISEAKRAVETWPVSKDARQGPAVLANLAVVYAWTGEPDLAFEQLNPLVKISGGIYYSTLKAPYWDPLRKDPRFDKLLAELAPKD